MPYISIQAASRFVPPCLSVDDIPLSLWIVTCSRPLPGRRIGLTRNTKGVWGGSFVGTASRRGSGRWWSVIGIERVHEVARMQRGLVLSTATNHHALSNSHRLIERAPIHASSCAVDPTCASSAIGMAVGSIARAAVVRTVFCRRLRGNVCGLPDDSSCRLIVVVVWYSVMVGSSAVLLLILESDGGVQLTSANRPCSNTYITNQADRLEMLHHTRYSVPWPSASLAPA